MHVRRLIDEGEGFNKFASIGSQCYSSNSPAELLDLANIIIYFERQLASIVFNHFRKYLVL